MAQRNGSFLPIGILFLMMSLPTLSSGTPNATWIAELPDSDLNVGSNWNTGEVPTDIANFNSSLPSIDTAPRTSANFTIGALNFQNSADAFTFTFNNSLLTFSGDNVGIFGYRTNPTLNLINLNNSALLGTQLVFNGTAYNTIGSANILVSNSGNGTDHSNCTNQIGCTATSSFVMGNGASLAIENTGTNDVSSAHVATAESQTFFGSPFIAGNNASISLSNTGTNSGDASGSEVGYFSTSGQYVFSSALTVGDSFSLSASNSGSDSSTGNANLVGWMTGNQASFTSTFTAGNGANLNLTNSGSSSGSGYGNQLGYIASDQFIFYEDCNFGDSLNLTLMNTGDSSSISISTPNNVGYITDAQLNAAANFTLGSDATISITNNGINTGSNQYVGTIYGDNQISVSGVFSAGNNLNLTLNNLGINSGSSENNFVGYLNTGAQAFFGSMAVGQNATLTFFNEGINSTSGENNLVSWLGTAGEASQLYLSGEFFANDSLTLTATNHGMDSSSGMGGNTVALQNASQLYFNTSFNVLDSATISVTNYGESIGMTDGNQVIGHVAGSQFLSDVTTAGDSFHFTAINYGTSSDPGNANDVGYVESTAVLFGDSLNIGDFCQLYAANLGINSGSGTMSSIGYLENGQVLVGGLSTLGNSADFEFYNVGSNSDGSSNSVGYIDSQSQFYSASPVYAGDSFYFFMGNGGKNDSSGTDNQVGTLAQAQAYMTGNWTVGDDATITFINKGLNTDGSSNLVGVVSQSGMTAYSQFHFLNNFTAGDNLNISISNTGTCSGSGSYNAVGWLASQGTSNQLFLGALFYVGDDTTITLTNAGAYSGTGSGNLTGYIGASQANLNTVNAGKNFTIQATNTSNTLDLSNPTGYIYANQLYFYSSFTVGDGALISAANSGTVGGAQIVFNNGFTPLGTCTLEAINTGSSGGGISITNGIGGDVAIILKNAPLAINNTLMPTFPLIIGSLTGDSSSTLSSTVGLIINADAGVDADFAGNTYGTIPSLFKIGPGKQTLSGNFDPLDPTTINEGTLNITGTFTGDVDVNPSGTLAGSGSIVGTVTNTGTVIPANTLTVTDFANSFSSAYNVKVGGQGSTYSIHATDTATLDGGKVLVSSFNGSYTFHTPYTILSATGGRTGAFGAVSAVSPMLKTSLSYGDTQVYLALQQNISAAADPSNQAAAVAAALDAVIAPNELQSMLLSEIVDLSFGQAKDALISISGEQYANQAFLAETVSRQFIRRMYDPLRPIVTCDFCHSTRCDDFTVWAELGGAFTSITGLGSSGFQITAGAQKRYCSDWVIGGAASYEGDFIQYKNHGGSEYANNALVGLYTLYRPKYFYGLLDLAYCYSLYSMDRKIDIGSATYKAHSNPKNSVLTFYGEMGGNWDTGPILIQPFFGVEASSYWRSRCTEQSSSGWQLVVNSKDRGNAYSRLGLHLSACTIPCNFLLSADFSWNCRLTSQDVKIAERLAEFPDSFKISGTKLNRSSFEYAFTVMNDVSQNGSIYFETTGEIWNRASTYTAIGGFAYSWGPGSGASK